MHNVRLVIAEARTLFRQGLASLFRAEPDFEVVGEAANGDEARRVCGRVQPDLILLDAALPDPPETDGLAIIASLRVLCPQSVVVVIGEAGDTLSHPSGVSEKKREVAAQAERRRALQLGAAACLRAIVDQAELMRILRLTLAAQECAETDRLTVAPESALDSDPSAETTSNRNARQDGNPTVTAREQAVLTLIAQGLCNKEIAHRLGISTQTVKNHVSHLLEKLALADRTQLAVYVIEHGMSLQDPDRLE